jgi:hypothetical protein
MCSGPILLYGIPRAVIDEKRTFVGEEDFFAVGASRSSYSGTPGVENSWVISSKNIPPPHSWQVPRNVCSRSWGVGPYVSPKLRYEDIGKPTEDQR